MTQNNSTYPPNSFAIGDKGLLGDNIELWELLRSTAWRVSRYAYAPYSHFHVGAAALVDDGRIISGCNVENISLGLTLCAECSVISQLYASGGGKLLALSCTDAQGNVIMPCGRCRQLIVEHADIDFIIDHPRNRMSLSELLPDAFGPAERDRIC